VGNDVTQQLPNPHSWMNALMPGGQADSNRGHRPTEKSATPEISTVGAADGDCQAQRGQHAPFFCPILQIMGVNICRNGRFLSRIKFFYCDP